MDVVKRSIQALGGRISITSRPGKGSTFTMSLPLTLAVLDGMVASTSRQPVGVPPTAIVGTLRPKSAEHPALGPAPPLPPPPHTSDPIAQPRPVPRFRLPP